MAYDNRDILKIGTFNLFNLVLPEVKYYGKRQYSREEFDKKKEWILEQLDKMDADVIGFQEVFHEEALQEIMLAHPKYSNAHIVMGERVGGSPAVAFVSKFPIKSYEVFLDFPEELEVEGLKIPFENFSRPILKVDVEVRDNLTITFFVAHLKSKRPLIPDDVEDRHDPLEISKGQARSLLLRAVEANALRTILMDELQHRTKPVVVIGDLNDTHTSVTTQIISGQSPPRHWPLEHKKKLWDILLYHTKDIQARQSSTDVYYTHIYNGHYESLDHIMVSEELVKENPDRVGRVAFVRTFNDHIIDETLTEDDIDCWQSDHAQVVVEIELEPLNKGYKHDYHD